MIVGRRGIGDVASHSAGSWVPNCAGTYNPTDEIDKAYAAGLTPSSTLLAKAALWVETCGSGSAIAPAVSAPPAKGGIVASMPRLRLLSLQPKVGQAMPNYGGGVPAGPTTGCTEQYCTELDAAADPCGYVTWAQSKGQMGSNLWASMVSACDMQTRGVEGTAAAQSLPLENWLSTNKTTVGLGLVVLVGAIILWKAL